MTIDSTRRAFMAKGLGSIAGLSGLAAGSALGAGAAVAPAVSPRKEPYSMAFDPRAKLRAISPRAKQLWPVIYVEAENTIEVVKRDVEASFEGGADAVVLEIGKDVPALRRAAAYVRAQYPAQKIGVNYLGDDTDPYGFINGFELAKELDLHIVWTDFSGVDLVREVPEVSLHTIEAARAPNAFYCSGVHMKYGTLLDPTKPLERSALQALGWVDGVVITGPRTGVPTDPERPVRTRRAIGDYPLGLASGVSAENFASVKESVDFCLVNTSISDEDHRIIVAKVKELRQVMGAELA